MAATIRNKNTNLVMISLESTKALKGFKSFLFNLISSVSLSPKINKPRSPIKNKEIPWI